MWNHFTTFTKQTIMLVLILTPCLYTFCGWYRFQGPLSNLILPFRNFSWFNCTTVRNLCAVGGHEPRKTCATCLGGDDDGGVGGGGWWTLFPFRVPQATITSSFQVQLPGHMDNVLPFNIIFRPHICSCTHPEPIQKNNSSISVRTLLRSIFHQKWTRVRFASCSCSLLGYSKFIYL